MTIENSVSNDFCSFVDSINVIDCTYPVRGGTKTLHFGKINLFTFTKTLTCRAGIKLMLVYVFDDGLCHFSYVYNLR